MCFYLKAQIRTTNLIKLPQVSYTAEEDVQVMHIKKPNQIFKQLDYVAN